MQVNNC